jgi:Family of unknown function (DUF5335)
MRTRELSRDDWVRSLDAFSKKHVGWIVTLELIGSNLGDQEEASGLPLIGISADVKDREPRIAVMVGGRFDAHLTHIIPRPKRIWLEESDEPAHDAVAVESRSSPAAARAQAPCRPTSTTLRGRSPYRVARTPISSRCCRRSRGSS